MAEWLLLSTKRWAKILPLLSISLLIIILGYTLQIYDISGADRLLLNATFIILCIPTLFFSIAILKNRDSKTALFIYAFTCFWSIYFLTHVTLPRVSHYDDIKKVVTVIFDDAHSQPFSVVNFDGFKPSLMVRLNQNVHHINSIDALQPIINSPKAPIYIISDESKFKQTLYNTDYQFKWTFENKVLLKY